jgi:hypothetical protein
MKKAGWLKDAVARPEGYFDAKGKKLKGATLSQEHCDEWNGVSKAKGRTIELVIQEIAEVPEAEEEVVVEVETKSSKGKKKGFFNRNK